MVDATKPIPNTTFAERAKARSQNKRVRKSDAEAKDVAPDAEAESKPVKAPVVKVLARRTAKRGRR